MTIQTLHSGSLTTRLVSATYDVETADGQHFQIEVETTQDIDRPATYTYVVGGWPNQPYRSLGEALSAIRRHLYQTTGAGR